MLLTTNEIEKLILDIEKNKIQFTVSIGVAQYNKTLDTKGIEDTIKRADEALYIAKENGRNQVIKSE